MASYHKLIFSALFFLVVCQANGEKRLILGSNIQYLGNEVENSKGDKGRTFITCEYRLIHFSEGKVVSTTDKCKTFLPLFASDYFNGGLTYVSGLNVKSVNSLKKELMVTTADDKYVTVIFPESQKGKSTIDFSSLKPGVEFDVVIPSDNKKGARWKPLLVQPPQ